jgi:soluble cytochrome b562
MKIRSALALLVILPSASSLRLAADPAAAPADAAAPATTTAPAAVTVPAASTAPATAAPAAAPDDDKKTDLELRMDKVSKAFRKLRHQVADPAQNESSLALVATVQAALKEAEDLTPEKADDVPADQRAKFIDDYKSGIKGMEDEFTKLSDALTAGKNADASALVTEIFNLEKKDHKDFRRPEKS